jgi:predicted alpha/beta hydrolase
MEVAARGLTQKKIGASVGYLGWQELVALRRSWWTKHDWSRVEVAAALPCAPSRLVGRKKQSIYAKYSFGGHSDRAQFNSL